MTESLADDKQEYFPWEDGAEQDSHASAFQELQAALELPETTQQHINDAYDRKAEEMLALYGTDPEMERQISELRDGFKWIFTGKAHDPLPVCFIIKTSDHTGDAVTLAGDYRPDFIYKLYECKNTIDDEIRKTPVRAQEDSINHNLQRVLHDTPGFRLLRSLREAAPVTTEAPLSHFDYQIRAGQVRAATAAAYGINESAVTSPGFPDAAEAYRKKLWKLDNETAPARQQRAPSDAETAQRISNYCWSLVNAKLEQKGLSLDRLEPHNRNIAAEEVLEDLAAEMQGDSLQTPAVEVFRRVIKRCLQFRAGDYDTNLDGPIARDFVHSLTLRHADIDSALNVTALAWARQTPLSDVQRMTATQVTEAKNAAKQNTVNFVHAGVDHRTVEHQRAIDLGSLLVDGRTAAQRAATVVIGTNASTATPGQLITEPDLRISLNAQAIAYGHSPFIPGYRLVGSHHAETETTHDFTRLEHDPYQPCTDVITEKDVDRLIDLYEQLGYDRLTSAIRSVQATANDFTMSALVRVIAEQSVYEHEPVAANSAFNSGTYSTTLPSSHHGRPVGQCTTMANLLRSSLTTLETPCRVLGGLTIGSTTPMINAVGHAQVLMVGKDGKQYVLDATPAGDPSLARPGERGGFSFGSRASLRDSVRDAILRRRAVKAARQAQANPEADTPEPEQAGQDETATKLTPKQRQELVRKSFATLANMKPHIVGQVAEWAGLPNPGQDPAQFDRAAVDLMQRRHGADPYGMFMERAYRAAPLPPASAEGQFSPDWLHEEIVTIDSNLRYIRTLAADPEVAQQITGRPLPATIARVMESQLTTMRTQYDTILQNRSRQRA